MDKRIGGTYTWRANNGGLYEIYTLADNGDGTANVEVTSVIQNGDGSIRVGDRFRTSISSFY